MRVKVENFGTAKDGQKAHLYHLKNKNGMEVVLTDMGAAIVKILVPDRTGKKVDVVLGFDKLESYYDNGEGFGAFVGRNANRIGGAKVVIAGKEYVLEANDGPNNLHSGSTRSNYQMYDAECLEESEMSTVEFSRMSPDMEQGFPGNLDMTVSYSLTEENELLIEYFAVADKDTVVNLTNHSYFNLAGHDSGDVLEHQMKIYSDKFTPTDDLLIPTGEIVDVTGTPMDFRQAKTIGQDIGADYRPLVQAGGYDHNYVLDQKEDEVGLAAELYSDKTGICMEVFTDLPGMQVYTGNFIDHKTGGKGSAVYEKRGGVCFESQYFPNACNEPKFQTSILPAGKEYDSVTVFRFSVR